MAGTDKITGGIVIVGGIGIMALLAGINDSIGGIMVVVMVGFLILWLITGPGNADLGKWLGKIGGGSRTGGGTIIV